MSLPYIFFQCRMELIDLKQSMEASLDLLRMGKNDEIIVLYFQIFILHN